MKTKIAFQDVKFIFTKRTSVQLIIHTRLFNTKQCLNNIQSKCRYACFSWILYFYLNIFLLIIWFLHIRLTHRRTNLNHFDNEGTDTINVYILISVSIIITLETNHPSHQYE